MTLQSKIIDLVSSILKNNTSDDLYLILFNSITNSINETPIYSIPKHKNPPTAYSIYYKKTKSLYKETDMTTTEIRRDIKKKWEVLDSTLKEVYIKQSGELLRDSKRQKKQKKQKIVSQPTQVVVQKVVEKLIPHLDYTDNINGFIKFCGMNYSNFPEDFTEISKIKTRWNNLSLIEKKAYFES